jgi:glycosyltransferase EpsE
MTEQPKVSVIMGIYNCAKTLPQAIESILAQTYANWELIMCDDGSTDETCAVAAAYKDQHPDRIILLKNEQNRKLSYTLNRCLEVADGELIARMDGDDMSRPDRFAKQVSFLREHPDCHLVGTDMQCFDETGYHGIRHAAVHPDRLTIRKTTPFFHATIMTYKSVYDALGGYTVGKRAERIEDVEMWFRFFQHGFSGDNIPEVLYDVCENYDTIRRRTIRERINSFRTLAWGYRLLGFPKRWLIKPAVLAAAKCLVPYRFIRWLRQRQGYLGGHA